MPPDDLADKQPTNLGWTVMQAMDLAGLSQSELSRRSGVPQSTISRIIFSKGRPQPENLRTIAPYLGLDGDQLVSQAGYGPAATEASAIRLVLKPLAERLNRLLEDGVLPEQDRTDLDRLVTGLVNQYETIAARNRKANENRAM